MHLTRIYLLTLVFLGAATAQTAVLRNARFEDDSPVSGWELNVYGAKPSLEQDQNVVRQGKTSLRIHSQEPSDTALAQELTLKPRQWYQFSAWVRTANLDPRGSGVSATLQVQRPGGSGRIAGAISRAGTVEWTNTTVAFQSPTDGRVRLCLFYVGFGKGTGTVWFDDVQLKELDLSSGTVRITREPIVPAEINPMQYGQFVEYLCDLVPSMWAEKLYDGRFEGLSPYKFAFIKQTGFKEKPWVPSGAVNRGHYILDKSTKVSGEVSQKIVAEGPEPSRLGVSQEGISVERAQPCVFKCWLRASNLTEAVRVRLHKEGRVYAECRCTPGTDWGKFEARLKPNTTDENATLTIEFRGPGTLWLDNVSLMPVETVGGWRKDVVEAVRAVKPRIIRFGGSALDEPGFGEFEWKDTIGDPDIRKPFRAWGGLQPTGPGLEEFVQFCHAVEAEPMICVRFTGRTPQQAAEQVEYFNGSRQTPMGGLRARNGHPKPYGIRYWQIGNERQSKEYDERVASFCEAMKKVDPGITILGSFPTAGSLRNAAQHLDYVCPHHYTPDLAECEGNLNWVRQLLHENAPNRAIKVAVTEWNTTAGDWGLRRAMLMTLANGLACARYHHLLHRNCDLVEIANRSNLINSFGSGFIQVDNHRLYKTPAYYAQWLYANLAGNRPLKVESSLPANAGLDLSATLDTETGQVQLFVVNDSQETATRLLDFSSYQKGRQRLAVWTLSDRENAGEPDVRNSFADPERVALKMKTIHARAGTFTFAFAPLSLTVIELAP